MKLRIRVTTTENDLVDDIKGDDEKTGMWGEYQFLGAGATLTETSLVLQ